MGRPGHRGKSFAIVGTVSCNQIHKCIHGLLIPFCSRASAVLQHNSCFPSLVSTPNMFIGSNQILCFASFNKASSSSFCVRLPVPSGTSLGLFQLILSSMVWDIRLAQMDWGLAGAFYTSIALCLSVVQNTWTLNCSDIFFFFFFLLLLSQVW